MNAVDEFVVYDNLKYTKKGWINRNRILVNGKASYITLPLRNDSDYLDIRDRYLAKIWLTERISMLRRITGSYKKAPYFDSGYPIIEECILFEELNLFRFILNSLHLIKNFLGIQTPVIVSSSIKIDHQQKAENKVISICKARNSDYYMNPVGGIQLYFKDQFMEQDINLNFLKTNDFSYQQFNHDFVPLLSIIDVIMFNSKEDIREWLSSFYTVI
jgi:hypothetical protein